MVATDSGLGARGARRDKASGATTGANVRGAVGVGTGEGRRAETSSC
jgi:hypothetical protein